MSRCPPLKCGWVKKQSRTGLLKNWKDRFVVLEAGNIKYFEKQLSSNLPPYGDNLKGEMNLKSANIMGTSSSSANRIYLVGNFANEKDMLLEVENAAEATEWTRQLQRHIDYANCLPDMVQPSLRSEVCIFFLNCMQSYVYDVCFFPVDWRMLT